MRPAACNSDLKSLISVFTAAATWASRVTLTPCERRLIRRIDRCGHITKNAERHALDGDRRLRACTRDQRRDPFDNGGVFLDRRYDLLDGLKASVDLLQSIGMPNRLQRNHDFSLSARRTAGRGKEWNYYGRDETSCAPLTVRLVAGFKLR